MALPREGWHKATGVWELTRAERRVAELAAEGWINLVIAEKLGIGCRGVENHLHAIYKKLLCDDEQNHRVVLAKYVWEGY